MTPTAKARRDHRARTPYTDRLVGRAGVEDVGSCRDELVARIADGLGLPRDLAREELRRIGL